MVTWIEEATCLSEVQTTAPSPDIVEGPLPPSTPPPRQDVARARLSAFVEGNLDICQYSTHAHHHNASPALVEGVLQDSPNHSTQRKTGKTSREKGARSRTAPPTGMPKPPKRGFTFPGFGSNRDESENPGEHQVRRQRKLGFFKPKGLRPLVRAVMLILRLRKASGAGRRSPG